MDTQATQLSHEQLLLRQAIAEAGVRCAVHGEPATMTSAIVTLARGGALCGPCLERLRLAPRD